MPLMLKNAKNVVVKTAAVGNGAVGIFKTITYNYPMYAINLRKHNNFKVNKMNNIHVLPTDKPSTLFFGININQEQNYFKTQNLFITSDEEIKEGDWFIRDGSIHKCFRVHKTDIEFLTSIDSVYCGSNTFWGKEFCKKIILTTDQYLIKDGVQSIDDEFLEWFVKNPSCEEVEIIDHARRLLFLEEYIPTYKIIIPKEEPKQEYQSECICDTECRGFVNVKCKVAKQETLEEALKNEIEFVNDNCRNLDFDLGFMTGGVIGAKWAQEKMYSEEEMLSFAWFLVKNIGQYSCDETAHFEGKYLEQFKKK